MKPIENTKTTTIKLEREVQERIKKDTKVLREKVWKSKGMTGFANDTLKEYQRLFAERYK